MSPDFPHHAGSPVPKSHPPRSQRHQAQSPDTALPPIQTAGHPVSSTQPVSGRADSGRAAYPQGTTPLPAGYPSRRARRELQGDSTDGRLAAAKQAEPLNLSSTAPATVQQGVAAENESAGNINPPQLSLRPEKTRQGNPVESRTSSRSTVTQPDESPKDSVLSTRRRKTKTSVLVLSGLGQTMLTIGVVLALFVVWQLYVTTLQVQGATAAAVESFSRSGVNEATKLTEIRRSDPPPDVTVPGVGQTFATLHVPRWDSMVIPVMQGTTQPILDTGYAGHYIDTQAPGELGNFALAAHRRSYGNSFRRVEELVTGDPLIVETSQAWLVYQVSGTQVVLPHQGGVINPVPNQPKDTVPTERMMTLTTCHPEYGNSHRFIVYSKFSYWVPRSSGRPVALQGLNAMQKTSPADTGQNPEIVFQSEISGNSEAPPVNSGEQIPGQPPLLGTAQTELAQ